MKNVYLFQPQYTVDLQKEKNYWIPYSVGCLWSYCSQFKDIKSAYQLVELFFKREDHESILNRMIDPSVIGFSCYQWNKNYNLSLAKKIKENWPDCIIVFGGPEVTDNFLDYLFIDTIVLAEGEHSFLDILRKHRFNQIIPFRYYKSRLTDLNFPSPFTTGVFDQIIKDNPNVKWAITLETNRGCPFSCTFCDWGSLTYSKVKRFDIERIKADIDWISNNPISYIFCADANFGIFKERDLEIAKLIADAGKRNKSLEAFNATFNKNNNEWSFKILEALGELNRGFTVSVQSLYQPTLKAVKRDNLGINDLRNIFNQCQLHNINSYTELILGLPYETKDTFINGLCELLELGQHNHIEIWPADLLVNSELSKDREKYGIQTVKTNKLFALFNKDEIDEYPEMVEVINATSTMTTDDLIDSFMYSWMIVNFHLQGYTQIISRYYRIKYNISYKEFYDKLLLDIKDSNLRPIYEYVRKNTENFFYNGELDTGLSAHNLVFAGCLEIYKNKEQLYEILSKYECLDLQRAYIYDINQQYPIQINCDFNVTNNKIEPINYKIEPKVKFDSIVDFTESFYMLRRKGLLKNRLT